MHSYVCTYYSMPLENIKVKIVAFIYIGTDIYIGKRKKQYILPYIVILYKCKIICLIFPLS